MRVLVISSALPPTRIAEADLTFHLCRRLADRGLDVHLLTSQGQSAGSPSSFAVHPLMRRWSWRELPRVGRLLRRLAPNAILLMYLGVLYGHHPMVTFLPTIARSIAPGARFVTQATNVWGSLPQRGSAGRRLLRRGAARWASPRSLDPSFGSLLRDSDRLIAMGERHRARLAELFPGAGAKSVVIPPPPLIPICADEDGAARRKGRLALGVRPGELLIAYFGRIYPAKGIDTLLYAFALASGRTSGLRLALIGGSAAHGFAGSASHEAELRGLAARLGIADAVAWTGELSWDGLEGSMYLRAADLCALPFPHGVDLNNSSFATATAHGLPILTTAPPASDTPFTRGEAPMLAPPFCHGENVFLFPARDARAMARAIEELTSDAGLRRRLGRGALQLGERWFSWDRAIDQTVHSLSGPIRASG